MLVVLPIPGMPYAFFIREWKWKWKRAYRNDKMRTVPVLGYHFKSLDRFLVADNVIQHEGAVFFYPLKRG